MKAEFLKIKSNQAGISTLEILIALALITVSITSATVIIFGNQSISVDSRTNSEALYKAQEILENARNTSRDDFYAVVPSKGVWLNGIAYATSTETSDADCGKRVSVNVAWDQENNRHSTTTLTTLLANLPLIKALEGDCEVSPPGDPGTPPGGGSGDDWSHPEYFGPGEDIGGQAIDLDVINKYVFLVNDQPEFAVINTTDANNPDPLGHIATEGFGFSSVDVAGDYAYIADFIETGINKYKYRILIINTDSSNNFLNPSIETSKNLQGIGLIDKNDAKEASWQPKIYYFDGKAYVGTHAVGGPELHIFDVSDPTDPNFPDEIGSVEIGSSINDIIIRDGLAHLATSDDNAELTVVDVNPVSPTYKQIVQTYNAANAGDGFSLYISGTKLYLGRDGKNNPNNPNLYVLNIADSSSNPQLISPKDIKDASSGAWLDINDILVTGSFIFLATDDPNEEFQVWHAADLTKVSSYDCFTGHTPNVMSALDFNGGDIYAAFRSNTDLQIFKPGTSCE